ncbi:TRAM domain-containing protein (plasmid) [Halorubrum salinarum]|uniref:TRAM domain-containing protein n=1 Tax=Halorubrum salinarum TaxID=2739057 RepID=A0A7D4BF51_9EURY|nr:TRAM domain-containing protein [Halorubrum salinarum]QKG94211.1 TRAM domain-containing protein [Halorubrum salinarum]
MEISEELQTLYSATVEERDGEYYLSVPAREIETGSLEVEESVRVALLSPASSTTTLGDAASSPEPPTEPAEPTGPPVSVGETREVDIESIGDQGDGIAKVDRGYVVIVPDTDLGETVTVEIEQVQDNVAFATVVDRNLRQAQ